MLLSWWHVFRLSVRPFPLLTFHQEASSPLYVIKGYGPIFTVYQSTSFPTLLDQNLTLSLLLLIDLIKDHRSFTHSCLQMEMNQ